LVPHGRCGRGRAIGHQPGWSLRMPIVRYILAECRADRVFALMVVALGGWSAVSLALLALNVFEPLRVQ
jgi:hypothetical protein